MSTIASFSSAQHDDKGRSSPPIRHRTRRNNYRYTCHLSATSSLQMPTGPSLQMHLDTPCCSLIAAPPSVAVFFLLFLSFLPPWYFSTNFHHYTVISVNSSSDFHSTIRVSQNLPVSNTWHFLVTYGDMAGTTFSKNSGS